MKRVKLYEDFISEANKGKVHRAAKQGSYPAVVVVVQDGKVIHQEPVSTPEVAPATFNVMQEKYPKALIHLEDKTGKRLFSESVVTEEVVYNSSNTKPEAAKKAKKEFGKLLPKPNKGVEPYEFAVVKTKSRNYRLAIKSGSYVAHEFMTNIKDDGILTADIVKKAVANIIKLNPEEFNESVVTEAMFSVKDLKEPGLIWWYNKEGDKAQVTKIDKIDNLNFPRAKDAPKDFDISWGMGTLDDWIEKTGEKNPKVGEVYDIAESVVTEAKNTIGLAFKSEDDYNGFVEFIEDEGGKIFKNIGWDHKTKSWEVIMDTSVLDDIYGEGHPGNKESGWYGALPTDFESVIIEGFVSEAFIGPFVFNDTMSDEELKAMYDGALDGYANWQKGFQHPKAKYKQAYQEIEKLLKKRGVEESVVKEGYDGNWSDFKYEFPMRFEEETGNSPKAIKKLAKKGNGYEVRTSTYMSQTEMEKVGLVLGLKLKSYTKDSIIAISVYESVVTEGREVNKFGIESQHIGKLQNGKMSKYTEGTSMPFGLISRPESGLSDTDKNAVKDYVNADNIVLGFYPMEDSNNDTMYNAVKAGGIKIIEDLVSKEYGLKLIETIKGKRHCAGDTCSLMHYLVFSKTNESVYTHILNMDQFLNESKSDFQVYHNQYSSTIDEVEKYANKMGYDLDAEEYGNAYVDGFFKPNDGQTKKDTLTLYKNGKEQKKALHVQIYGMGNKFEINMYIN